MSLHSLISIQARISQIQQRFGTPAASPGSTGSAPAPPDATASFERALERAVATRGSFRGTVPPFKPVGGTSDKMKTFLEAAIAQTGDRYVWGSSASPSDADPDAFDCSELVKWAAARSGVQLNDGSWLQYLQLKQQGATIPVEQALRTPGALLFGFSHEPRPGGGRPDGAHVAISLGDGRTIEARGRKYGVGTWEAGDRFQYAALVPGLS